MKFKFIILFFFFFTSSFTQSYVDYSNAFSKANQEHANTALNEDYLNEEEKKIFYYLNLLRLNPKLFIDSFLSTKNQQIHLLRCKSSKKKCTYFNSLIRDLYILDKLNIIKPNKDYFQHAYCHSYKSGKKGYVGHSRNKSGCSSLPLPYAESCHYGSDLALDIVLDLLIDCGVSNLAHRNMLISSKYTMMGASISEHKNYNFNAVLDLTY